MIEEAAVVAVGMAAAVVDTVAVAATEVVVVGMEVTEAAVADSSALCPTNRLSPPTLATFPHTQSRGMSTKFSRV